MGDMFFYGFGGDFIVLCDLCIVYVGDLVE